MFPNLNLNPMIRTKIENCGFLGAAYCHNTALNSCSSYSSLLDWLLWVALTGCILLLTLIYDLLRTTI